jgi:hypothetical protein
LIIQGSDSIDTGNRQALLQKPRLDMNNLKNHRPVSNLHFVSNIIEKVVTTRIEDHLDKHKHDNRQLVYRSFHCTVSALIRVHHDIATALVNNSCSILLAIGSALSDSRALTIRFQFAA